MISIKSKEEIEIMREGGQILAGTLEKLQEKAKSGTNAADLDRLARELVFSSGASPSFLNYTPGEKGRGYPAALCVSVNDEVVHGLPLENKVLFEGDLVKLDLGVKWKNLFTDATIMFGIGKIPPVAEKLIRVTKECFELGAGEIRPGASLEKYARAVQKNAEKNGFSVVRDLVGHGVGHAVHEPPQILNYVSGKMNDIKLKEGMTLALEPMVNVGGWEIRLGEDGWTYRTADGKLNGHFEHTVAVTKEGCEVLTKI
jgi:methionyl aminopeptidase